MLKFPCLVLDHDDTVVQTEKTLGYPYFCEVLKKFRPGQTISLTDYVNDCHKLGFSEMCRLRWQFTQEEQKEEYNGWMGYIMTHTPDIFSGIEEVIREQKDRGGLICVVSHSSAENIARDYRHHFGSLPDSIYGWDLPPALRKPSPYPLLNIMERYKLRANELLMVDDSLLGWEMANAANIRCGFAAWGKQDYPELCQKMTQRCSHSFLTPKSLYHFLFEE